MSVVSMVRSVVVAKHRVCVRLMVVVGGGANCGRCCMVMVGVVVSRCVRSGGGHRGCVVSGHRGRLVVVGGHGGTSAGRLMSVPGLVLPGGLVVTVQYTKGVIHATVLGCRGRCKRCGTIGGRRCGSRNRCCRSLLSALYRTHL